MAFPLLAGCLTNALWNWSDPEAVPDLDTTTTPCRIDAILAPADTDPRAPGVYAVGFTPNPGARVPRHVATKAATGPAWLVVEPRLDFPAAGAMDAFEPRGHELDVFDGQHLRRRTNNVRMTLYGSVPRQVIGTMLAPDAVPEPLRSVELPDEEIPPWGPARRAIRGLQEHPWPRLLSAEGSPAPEGRAEPVAFLDRDGRPVSPRAVTDALIAPASDPRAAAMADASLLARVTEGRRTVFVKIPIPVLLNADALDLRRDGALVAFAWSRRGVGRFVDAGALPRGLVAFDLPLVDRNLQYEWSVEVPAETGWKTPFQYLLTPIFAVLDFLIESNPALRNLRDALFPPPPPPVRPRRGNN